MRWNRARRSTNVEDRRGRAPAIAAGAGGLGIIGVLLAMLYSLLLLPALLAIAPLKAKRGGSDRGLAVSGHLLTRIGDMVTAHPARVVGVWGLVGLLAVPGLLEAHFSHDGMKWFPKEDPLRQAADLIDENFGGSGGIEVVIHTDVENGLHEPDVMQRVERAMRSAPRWPPVSSSAAARAAASSPTRRRAGRRAPAGRSDRRGPRRPPCRCARRG